MPGWLTLIGSGETAPAMLKVQRSLLACLPQPPKPALIDTPAGFELGLETIHARFREFFRTRLNLPLQIASVRSADEDPARLAEALTIVSRANYLLAGPGSPTYAVRQWRDSPLYAALVERWLAGAQIAFASSAAIAISRHTLPVYEIYKVGQDLHWIDGLDMLGRFGLDLAIVTHWNNAEGGTHDTRACFMGMERFQRLRALLPPTAVVLAIDEHTACTLDLDRATARVMGRGGVTILHGVNSLRYTAGETFPLDELAPKAQPPATQPATPTADIPNASRTIAQASALLAGGDIAGGLRLAAGAAPAHLASLLHQAARAVEETTSPHDPTEALIRLLIELRAELRKSGLWPLADEARRRLQELGIVLRDTPQGTEWERVA